MVGQGVTAAITGALGRAFGVDFATMLKAGSPGGSAAQIGAEAAAQTGSQSQVGVQTNIESFAQQQHNDYAQTKAMEQAVSFFKNYLGQMSATTGVPPEQLLSELDNQQVAASQQVLTQLTMPT